MLGLKLQLAFASEELREVCENKSDAEKRLGMKVAHALRRRLSDLKSASTFNELPISRPRKNANDCVIALPDGWRLVVTGGHGQNPTHPDGSIDWNEITRIKITKIEKRNE